MKPDTTPADLPSRNGAQADRLAVIAGIESDNRQKRFPIGWGDFGLILTGLSGFTIWLALPPKPELPAYEYGQPRNARFVAGEGCQLPQQETTAALQVTERCRLAAEAYRQQSDDLVQQTRAADAAQAQARLAYTSGWASLIQTIGGILTLIAASFAAFYARQAAIETRRGAKAAKKQLKLARELGELELRSHISIIDMKAKFQNKALSLTFSLHNSGPTIARNIKTTMLLRASHSGRRSELPEAYEGKINSVMPRGSHEHKTIHIAGDTHPEIGKFLHEGLGFITIRLDVEYDDYFKTPRGTRRSYGLSLSQLTPGYSPIAESHVITSQKRHKMKLAKPLVKS